MANKKVKIREDEHLFIAGMTGSGKTYLAEQYANGFDNVIVLDTKGFFNWESSTEEIKIFTKLEDLKEFEEGKAIYRPRFEELEMEYYDEFFKWIYQRQNTVVLIDELMQVAPKPMLFPKWLKGCWTRGRQLGVAVWSLTQRPKDIPLIAMSEATHFFIFRLQLQDDRDRVAKITGYTEMQKNAGKSLKDYVFWYYNSKQANRPVRGRLD